MKQVSLDVVFPNGGNTYTYVCEDYNPEHNYAIVISPYNGPTVVSVVREKPFDEMKHANYKKVFMTFEFHAPT